MVPDVLVRCVPHSPNMRKMKDRNFTVRKMFQLGILIIEMWLCWQTLTMLHANLYIQQAQVVQKLDSAHIPRINHYPEDKYYGKQLHYPLDSDLSSG